MQPAPGHQSGLPVAIFTQTLTLRLMTAVFLAPFGIWLTFFTDHSGIDIAGIDILLALGLFLLGLTAAAWVNGHLFLVTLYPDAIVRRNIFGTKRAEFTERTRFFHKNVQEYLNGIPAGKHIYITVDDRRNRVALNSNVRDMASLQQLLMELELTRYYAKRLEDYRKGRRMDFGPISLHQGKILYRGKSLPLSDANMTVVSGYFRVKANGKMLAYCHVPLGKIANMSTLFRLIEDGETAPITAPAATPEIPDSEPEPVAASPTPSPSARPEPPPSMSAPVATLCPKCEKEMVKRRATSGEHAGKLFWVCSAFPACRGVLPAAE